MNIKSDFRKIARLDVSPLIEKVCQLTEADWAADDMRQQAFETHKATQSIRLVVNIEPSKTKANVHALYGELKEEIAPILSVVKRDIDKRVKAKKLVAEYGKPTFARVILTRLMPQCTG